MRHYGDITKINGSEIEPVNAIIGGSPCQDLSFAGKRAGLAGERSGLFMEQIRIIKEMREKYGKPRYMVWENVPGAFSSNKGEDFRIVLEETAHIIDKTAVIPRPPQGKWTTAGAVVGDGWSIAWRVFDAQFWGVPQRRRRIALVADFGGLTAPEILFERESVPGGIDESGAQRKGTAADTERSADTAISFQERAGCDGGVKESSYSTTEREHSLPSTTSESCKEPILLESNQNHAVIKQDGISTALPASAGMGGGYVPAVCYGISAYESNSMKSGNPRSGIYEAKTARTIDGNGGSPACNQGGMAIVQAAGFKYRNGAKARSIDYHVEKQTTLGTDGNEAVCIEMTSTKNTIIKDGICPTLTARMGTGGNQVNDVLTNEPVCYNGENVTSPANRQSPQRGDPCHTLTSDSRNYLIEEPKLYDNQRQGVYGENGVSSTFTAHEASEGRDLVCAVDCRNGTENADTNGTLQAKSNGGVSYNLQNVVRTNAIVRRLTPLECERLQGYPDGWTDIGEWTDSKGKKHKAADSPRYKALGNSIALPSWVYVLRKLMICCGADLTMGSLFDGIGGFPLIWQRLGGAPVWASEIEEFCIAVTKLQFGGA